MKNTSLLLSFLFFAVMTVSAQQSTSVQQIPANVRNTFTSTYPNATNITWEQSQGYFIPIFTDNNVTTKLLIDLKGTLVHSSVQIASSTLPATVTAYINSNYAGQAITDAQRLTMFNRATRYEVVVGTKDLLFDSNGNFLKIATGPLKQ